MVLYLLRTNEIEEKKNDVYTHLPTFNHIILYKKVPIFCADPQVLRKGRVRIKNSNYVYYWEITVLSTKFKLYKNLIITVKTVVVKMLESKFHSLVHKGNRFLVVLHYATNS